MFVNIRFILQCRPKYWISFTLCKHPSITKFPFKMSKSRSYPKQKLNALLCLLKNPIQHYFFFPFSDVIFCTVEFCLIIITKIIVLPPMPHQWFSMFCNIATHSLRAVVVQCYPGRQCCSRTSLAVTGGIMSGQWSCQPLVCCVRTITAVFTSGDRQQFRFSR